MAGEAYNTLAGYQRHQPERRTGQAMSLPRAHTARLVIEVADNSPAAQAGLRSSQQS